MLLLYLFLVIVFCVVGAFIGMLTGLLPGLHVNNIALILVSLSGGIIAFCAPLSGFGVSESFVFVLICCFILGVSVSHSFHNCLPATFLGAPDEDTALSVLPAHALLLQGRGYEAVVLSALGSLGAIFVCFLLFFPLRFVIGEPFSLYSVLQKSMAWILIAVVVLMIFTEKGKIRVFNVSGRASSFFGMLFAVFLFFLCGFFGLVLLDFSVSSPFGLPAPVLFPALAGLFGAPTLVTSLLSKPVIPVQVITRVELSRKEKKTSVVSVFAGSCAGVLVSILPGVTSAVGTILAMTFRGKADHEQTIMTLSAVNTAAAFFVVVVLFILLRARSGVVLAMSELIAVEQWGSVLMPLDLVYFLVAILVSGVVSFGLVIWCGRWFARSFVRVPYSLLVGLTLVLVLVLVFVFTGVFGVLVFLVATCIGLLPVLWGVRRSHCMGVLLIPVILYFL
ncbi:MAG: tripartite tricarboxylate transporter permease [Methanobacteriota archaeon]